METIRIFLVIVLSFPANSVHLIYRHVTAKNVIALSFDILLFENLKNLLILKKRNIYFSYFFEEQVERIVLF